MQFVNCSVPVAAKAQAVCAPSESDGGVAHLIRTLLQTIKLIPVTTFPAGQKILFVPPPTAVVFVALL